MYRISALVLALLMLMAPVLAESEFLIPQDQIKTDSANYKTATVESSGLEYRVSVSADEFYPYTTIVRQQLSGTRFVKYYVSRGDQVKEGDVLATFTLETDQVTLASLRLELERTRESLEEAKLNAEESTLELQRALLTAADSYEQELTRLKLQRAELELEMTVFNQERAIASLEERIAEIEAEQQGVTLVAPCNGVVQDVTYKREGESVYVGEGLVTLYRTDAMLLCIDNSSGAFRYGMDVTVEVGPNKERTQLSGRVVGADVLLPEAERTNAAYIAFEAPEGVELTRPTVSCATFKLENILLVSRTAVTMEGGEYCLTLLVDGVPQKRFVNAVLATGVTKAWILQGLNAGDQVVLD